MLTRLAIVWTVVVSVLGAAAAILLPPAHSDPGYVQCLEDGRLNTYINALHPCPGIVGPGYGGGNTRWPGIPDEGDE